MAEIQRWLLIDCNGLCHRAFHTTGELSHQGIKTGVIYGFLQTILILMEDFQTKNIAFCFDVGESKRVNIFPGYKESRKKKLEKMTDKEKKLRAELVLQMFQLRTRYLKMIGFRNVFGAKGYEADDIIASICWGRTYPRDEIIIVSSDTDFFQLIDRKTSILNPVKKKIITVDSFKEEHGYHPVNWTEVKAMWGCKTDNIPGIPGVGEKTAEKNLIKGLIPDSPTITRNIKLIELPLKGTPKFKLRKDRVTNEGWEKVCDLLGAPSLMRRVR